MGNINLEFSTSNRQSKTQILQSCKTCHFTMGLRLNHLFKVKLTCNLSGQLKRIKLWLTLILKIDTSVVWPNYRRGKSPLCTTRVIINNWLLSKLLSSFKVALLVRILFLRYIQLQECAKAVYHL